VDDIYRSKLNELNDQANKFREMAAFAREESQSMKVRVRELENSAKDHQGIVDGLNHRVKVWKLFLIEQSL
jgi:hypothetical protein